MRDHGPEDTSNSWLRTRFEQIQQPPAGWRLVIINKSDEVPVRVCDCPVPDQRNVPARFNTVHYRNTSLSEEFRDHRPRGLLRVIIGYHNRVCKTIAAFLTVDSGQKAFQ
jgi:hypothetical protein